MGKEVVVLEPIINEPSYSKESFVNAKDIYSGFERDIFYVVLDDELMYTKEEAERLKDRLLKGDVE